MVETGNLNHEDKLHEVHKAEVKKSHALRLISSAPNRLAECDAAFL